jgi:hypothetical protein
MGHQLRKGKSKCQDENYSVCLVGACSLDQETRFGSDVAFIDHLRSDHDYPERDLVQLKLCLDQGLEAVAEEEEACIERQQHEEEELNRDIEDSLIDDGSAPSKRVRVR